MKGFIFSVLTIRLIPKWGKTVANRQPCTLLTIIRRFRAIVALHPKKDKTHVAIRTGKASGMA